MPSKKVAAVDLDGTIFEGFGDAIVECMNLFGVKINRTNLFNPYNIESCDEVKSKLPVSGWFDYMDEYLIEKRYYSTFKPIPNSHQGLDFLRSIGYELIVITSRGSHLDETQKEHLCHIMVKDTNKTLDEHFPGYFSDVIFIPKGISKGEIASGRKATVLIEDSLTELLRSSGYIQKAVLVNRPYNQTNESLRNNGDRYVVKEQRLFYRIPDLTYLNRLRL